MTVPANQPNYIQYSGDGTTTAFAYPYAFFDAADLEVLTLVGEVATRKTLGVDFTVSGGMDTASLQPGAGTITFVTAPPAGTSVFITGVPLDGQPTHFIPGGAFPIQNNEKMLDRLTLLVQRLESLMFQALKFPEWDKGSSSVLPGPLARAGYYLGFDTNGNPVLLGTPLPQPQVVYAPVPLQNNVPSGLPVPNFPTLDPTKYTVYRVYYDITLETTTLDPAYKIGRENGWLIFSWTGDPQNLQWILERDGHVPETSGISNTVDPLITFFISGNQLKYKSANNADFISCTLKFQIEEAL